MIITKLENNKITYFTKNQKVKIIGDIKNEFMSCVKEIAKAGTVYLLAEKEFMQERDLFENLLQINDYTVKTVDDYSKVYSNELQENAELIICVGGEKIAEKFCGNKCLLVLCKMDMQKVFCNNYAGIVLLKNNLLLSDFQTLAHCYGSLMIKLVSIFDYKLQGICYKKQKDLFVIEKIEEIITNLFSKYYIYYRDSEFTMDLLEAIVNVGQLESLLQDSKCLQNYDIVCKTVTSVAKSKRMIGEYSMIVGWFALNTICVLNKNNTNDLFLPCNLQDDAEYVSTKIGDEKSDLFKIASVNDANEYQRLKAVEQEYKTEIDEYINKILVVAKNAMKNYRRIYYDAGLEISTSITLNTLSEAIKKSIAFVPNYSYLKNKRILGVI